MEETRTILKPTIQAPTMNFMMPLHILLLLEGLNFVVAIATNFLEQKTNWNDTISRTN